jgi:hypothetical protein
MEPLNWLAIGTGVVAAFLAGWAIYSPMLFGKAWAAGSGVELGSASSMPVGAMVLQVVGLIFLALVIGLTAQINALFTAIFAILAAAGLVVSNGAFSGKSTAAMAVDGGYIVVAGALMIVAQGIF